MSKDGQGLAGNKGSFFLRHAGLDQYLVKLNRGWPTLLETVRRRQAVATIVLQAILLRIPAETKAGADLLVEFSIEDLLAAVQQDMEMHSSLKDPLAAVERGLNYLHEQKSLLCRKDWRYFAVR